MWQGQKFERVYLKTHPKNRVVFVALNAQKISILQGTRRFKVMTTMDTKKDPYHTWEKHGKMRS